ncbi:hypothetical protein ATCM_14015 [Stenotrophomonas sp. ATCM1_4]|nr:hypothetical protein ATCM_14015 [Stenotrophomonas sp. ATCM1_4]
MPAIQHGTGGAEPRSASIPAQHACAHPLHHPCTSSRELLRIGHARRRGQRHRTLTASCINDATGIALALRASPLREDIAPATGNAFDQSHTAGSVLRFNAAQQADERIHEVLARALPAAVDDVRRDAMQD